MSTSENSPASQALLSAALGGLLCVAACSSAKNPDAPLMPDSGDGANTAPFECDGGVVPDAGITSSTVVSLTLADFTDQCDALGGVVEIQPHCGGSNLCRGMSYDEGTQVLTHHTCRGTNTCAGYSCIVC